MAFCTECGSRLPDDAIFCPNCGASMTTSAKKESSASSEIAQEEVKAVAYSAPVTVEAKSEPVAFQTSGEYVAPTQGNYSTPTQGTYMPPVQSTYAPPSQNNYAPAQPPCQGAYSPQAQSQYNQPNAYGYAPYQGGGVNTMAPKKSGGKTAIIVIASVVVFIVLAIILISSLGSDPYVGYWESVGADFGNGIVTEDESGASVVGAIDIQINSDGSAYVATAYSSNIAEGKWEESDDGITITSDEGSIDLAYKDDQLIYDNDGNPFYFEQVDGDINNPSVPHGSISDTATDTSASGVAGSGYVGNKDYYISVIGAEDFTDVDGEAAIRVYYEYTNNTETYRSMSAYDALSYSATQDGNQLTETYSADYNSATDGANYSIRNGLTMQCCADFKYNPNGGSVDFNVSSDDDGETGGTVTASYVPGSLPGAPAPYVITPILNPQWALQLSTEGTLDSYYVSVVSSEWALDENGNQAIRIYYDFTNNSANNISFSDAIYVFSYQDGISLEYAYATEDSESDSNYFTEIAPGTTIQTSCMFLVRNVTSPIEAEAEAISNSGAVGQMFNPNK